MTGFIIDYSGNEYRLPELFAWSVEHTDGSAADCFSVQFGYDAQMYAPLHGAVRFRAEHDGQVVFYGVVDDFTVTLDGEGLRVVLSGRGMGALLLDNESEAVEYGVCTIEDIVTNHIYPTGITDIQYGSFTPISGYTVASGSSQFAAVRDFCQCSGGVMPRFTRTGKLILTGETGVRYRLNTDSAVKLKMTDRRYGIISRVTVKRTNGERKVVTNESFSARGGNCTRVMQVPNSTGYDKMRWTGEYQIAKSEEGSFTVEVTLQETFAAFAGDVVEANFTYFGVSGAFYVKNSRSWSDGKSFGTKLTLERMG